MKCKVCGKEFELLAENKKIVKKNNIIVQNDYLLEAFDCPFCGCQNSVNIHYEEVKHDRQCRGNDE